MVLSSSHQLCVGGNCGPLTSSPCHQTCYQKIENESLISEYPVMTACLLSLSTTKFNTNNNNYYNYSTSFK